MPTTETAWNDADRLQRDSTPANASASSKPAGRLADPSRSKTSTNRVDLAKGPVVLVGIEEPNVAGLLRPSLKPKPSFEMYARHSTAASAEFRTHVAKKSSEQNIKRHDDEPFGNSATFSSFVKAPPSSVAEDVVRSQPVIPDYSGSLYECPDCRLSIREDFKNYWGMLRDDTVGVMNLNNLLILGTATGGALVMRSNYDDRVRRYTAQHPNRWGNANNFLGEIGDVPVQIPVLLGLWGYSVWQQDDELHKFSKTLISAYTITGLTTVAIKVAANTKRPSETFNNGRYGFPSYHAASSFSIAAVVDEYYGPKAGIPAYALAGLIGWSRIDTRDHDLSDVVFGAALGYVIGKSVAGRHLYCDSRVRILPYVNPIGGAGLSFEY